MLEKLGFQQLVEETLTVKRKTKAMPMYRFVLAMVLACRPHAAHDLGDGAPAVSVLGGQNLAACRARGRQP
jgi:hypothetical protein